MRLSHVSRGSGAVTLDFGADAVIVREVPLARQRAARLAGGALLGVFGLAAVAGNSEDRGHLRLATVAWVVAGVLLVAGLVGGALWLVLARRGRHRDSSIITASSVLTASSAVEGGEITVSLRTADGTEQQFSARGHAGAMLASEFGRLLAVTDTSADGPPPRG